MPKKILCDICRSDNQDLPWSVRIAPLICWVCEMTLIIRRHYTMDGISEQAFIDRMKAKYILREI